MVGTYAFLVASKAASLRKVYGSKVYPESCSKTSSSRAFWVVSQPTYGGERFNKGEDGDGEVEPRSTGDVDTSLARTKDHIALRKPEEIIMETVGQREYGLEMKKQHHIFN
jgi:hypothetical protein